MFVFWTFVWALVILSFLNDIFQWRIPPELQIPEILFKNIGGLPSFYAFKLALDTDVESLNGWLQKFIDEELENLPVLEFNSIQRTIPKCSLIKSSSTRCISTGTSTTASTGAPDCNRFDERCVQFWLQKSGHRAINCFDSSGKQLDCNTKGIHVQRIYYNKTQVMLLTSTQTPQQILIEEIKDCHDYFTKPDKSLIRISGIQSARDILLRQHTRTTIFYSSNQTSFEDLLNSGELCTCTDCFEINKNSHSEAPMFFGGYSARLLTETNRTNLNVTTIWKEEESVNQLDFQLEAEIIDRTTPTFWRRPGRFECPSEITCPLELFYIFHVQENLVITDCFLEILFLLSVVLYQRRGGRKYFNL